MIATLVKKAGRSIVCTILEAQVARLRTRHTFQVVAVVGSIGKTSTKMAIAQCLERSLKVRYQTGNYNDRVTVPLIFFDQPLPPLWNVLAWTKVFLSNQRQISGAYDYDVVIVELGVDGPGQMQFFDYVKPDISVVSAITPEHMEYFKTLDAVAAEELGVIAFSRRTLVNADDTPANYLKGKDDETVLTYGTIGSPAYRATNIADNGLHGSDAIFKLADGVPFATQVHIIGLPGVKIALAAAAVGQLIGIDQADLQQGVAAIEPFAGRMRVFDGIKESTIIDDTYNASPAPVLSALDVLYKAESSQRIAILGAMNELGEYSREAHIEVGDYCRHDKLDMVVTIGRDAAEYLAPAARAQGCQVKTFMNPYDAGEYVRERLKPHAVVLAEGSQNGVFAEEAIKPLLQHAEDAMKMARQSPYWLAVKQRQFKR